MSSPTPVTVIFPATGPIPTAIALAICGFTLFIGVTLGIALLHPDDDVRDDARRLLIALLAPVTAFLRALARRLK